MYRLAPLGTVPLPIWVVKKGICVRRTKPANPEVERGRDAAAPSMISGRLAARITAAARSSASRCATGVSIGCTAIGSRSGPSSPATSSGSSSNTGPGRSSMAMRKASRTTVGMLAAVAICRDGFVSGLKALTMSTIWKRAWRLVWIAFCPVIITVGIAPR
jgi:hypothetical protein